MKRALQDDQNELLDALRHAAGGPELDVLLPRERQHERFAGAAAHLLTEGWMAGRPWLQGQPTAGPDEAAVLAAARQAGQTLASDLADDVLGLLRHRLAESLADMAEAGNAAQDVASAAYREWKGQRIESTAGDFITRAFAAGAVAACSGVPVKWLVDDNGQPCPDCDDNALAGNQPAGEPFPTGQAHPPVHPGCRCVLVVSS